MAESDNPAGTMGETTEKVISTPESTSKVEAGSFFSLTLVWVIIMIIAVLFLISATVYVIIVVVQSSGTGILNDNTYCSDLTSGLKDISNVAFCADEGLIKYDPDLLVNSGPAQVGYQQVCRQFCPSGQYDTTTDTCSDTDPVTQQRVTNCVNATKPVNCIGQAKAIAISNGTPYYAQEANLIGCLGCACSPTCVTCTTK